MIRVLDPTTAVTRAGQKIGTTAYMSDRLLVRGEQVWNRDRRVDEILAQFGWVLRPPERYRDEIPRRQPRAPFDLESQQAVSFELRVATESPSAAPDAWTALQQIRTAVPELDQAFELVHVFTASGGGGYWHGIGGGGYWHGIGGGGYWHGIGTPDEYAVPGYGGKSPVAVVIDDPSRTAPRLKRPPVVVMPDTGIGPHPWFPDAAVVGVQPPPASLGVTVFGSSVADATDGVGSRLTGGLDNLAGHGTFIAGIVRQICPPARLVAHAIMGSDGLVYEDAVLDLLQNLLDTQLAALASGDTAAVIDVLTLSFGGYHEDVPDEDSDPSVLSGSSLATMLRDLGRAGVLVVAGAGNDATTRPFVPAAFAGDTAAGKGGLPLVSVGSLNPDRSKVSLFSNAGAWVTTYRHGAAIVSTLPQRQNASSQASTNVPGIATLPENDQPAAREGKLSTPQDRATIDLDNFSSGFGIWSGTSFAAPVLAGQLASALVGLGTDAADLDSLVKRGWAALAKVLRPIRRP